MGSAEDLLGQMREKRNSRAGNPAGEFRSVQVEAHQITAESQTRVKLSAKGELELSSRFTTLSTQPTLPVCFTGSGAGLRANVVWSPVLPPHLLGQGSAVTPVCR